MNDEENVFQSTSGRVLSKAFEGLTKNSVYVSLSETSLYFIYHQIKEFSAELPHFETLIITQNI